VFAQRFLKLEIIPFWLVIWFNNETSDETPRRNLVKIISSSQNFEFFDDRPLHLYNTYSIVPDLLGIVLLFSENTLESRKWRFKNCSESLCLDCSKCWRNWSILIEFIDLCWEKLDRSIPL